MKVEIDLEEVKAYIVAQGDDCDEWYGPEDYMTGDTIRRMFDYLNEEKASKEIDDFINGLGE
jgi:hypothetical protein